MTNTHESRRHRRRRLHRQQPGARAERPRCGRHHRRRRPDRRHQICQPGGAALPTTWTWTSFYDRFAARRVRPHRRRASPGRLLRHHGNTRPLHDGEQLHAVVQAARRLSGQGTRLLYASSAAVYGRSGGFTETPAPSSSPLNVYGYSKLLFDQRLFGARWGLPAVARQPGGRVALLQCLRPPRAAQGAHGLGGFPPLQPVPQHRPCLKLFGEYGGYGAGPAGARFRPGSTTWWR
jgi:hypothetical protein